MNNFATFDSSYPDDSTEDANGEVIVPAGRTIAEAIAAKLPPEISLGQHSFYGWKFEFEYGVNRRGWALLQQPGPWLLIVEAKTGFFERGKTKESAFQEAIQAIQSAILAVPEITNVAWMSQDEFNASQRKSEPKGI